MDRQEHQKRHEELHQALDELTGDFISHTKRMPSKTSVLDLMRWSRLQVASPLSLPVQHRTGGMTDNAGQELSIEEMKNTV